MKRSCLKYLYILVLGIMTASLATVASAQFATEVIPTKKIKIKDNPKPTKRQLQVQAKDAGVQLADAGDPATEGASAHFYSATDSHCALFPGGADWKVSTKKFKYKSKLTKHQAQLQDGKLKVKVKSGVVYSLADDGTQGTVNVVVQFGNGSSNYCMRCTTPKKDDAKNYQAKNCAPTECDAAPPGCAPGATTTTTTTVTTTTTTTMFAPGVILQGFLPPTNGRFNYAGLGVPGADTRCETEFAATHACTLPELQSAEAAGDLDGATDINGTQVTTLWSIDDPLVLPDHQCDQNIDWDYVTAHLPLVGDYVDLDNGAGTLGPVLNSACNPTRWVGCCLD